MVSVHVSMRCHKCDERAVIRMRQHRLALCRTHYIEWFVQQTQRMIEKYHMFTHEEKVLVAVSGGKDSLALWDVLWQLGYHAEGLYIHLGIDEGIQYSTESERLAREFAEQRGLVLHVINVAQVHGETVPEIARRTRRGRDKPCAVCGLIKRHDMNQAALDLGFNVLATAHNLDDEVAFLFGNVFHWNLEQMRRQSPVLPESPGFARKVKPFCRFSERETAAYSLVRGIAYIEDECPFAEGSKQLLYKDLLNRLEEVEPGAKLRFYLGFLEARDSGQLILPREEESPLELHPCPRCGQPTTSPGLCAYCRLFESESLGTLGTPVQPK